MTRWLIGMMGVGKSTCGLLAAERLDMRFLDSDDLVEAAAGQKIDEIWAESGESHFRAIESEVIDAIEDAPDLIVSVGGGAPMDDAIARRLSSSDFVMWLHCSLDELARRIGTDETRPLISDGDVATTLESLMAERVERYASLADARIDTTGLTPDQVVERMKTLWSK